MFKRLRTDESREREVAATAWARGLSGVTLLRDVEVRSVAKVAGIVTAIKVPPRDAPAAFEATVSDGTGEIRSAWTGRRELPGLKLGSRVMLEGRVGQDAKGRLQVVNPSYELEAVAH